VQAAQNCDTPAADQTQDAHEQAFLVEINKYRGQNGLVPLTLNPSLTRAATWMAQDMASYNYFSHTDRLGRQWDQRMAQCDVATVNGAAYWSENIAAWYDTGPAVFDGWKNSPGHNANMLNANFRSIGIARIASTLPTAGNTTPGFYWVTDFSNEVVQAAPAPPAQNVNTPCTQPTIDVQPSTNYGIVGSSFKVIGTAVCTQPVFQFWVAKVAGPQVGLYDPSVPWEVGQYYSTTNTWTWRPPTPGYYYVTFWVKNAAGPEPANGMFDTGLQLNMMVIQ
jgi:uncharacterized protein YkwD